jgi:GNAT superfamily N-acetyltransferase
MRSRELPASRTWRMARPDGILADPRDGFVVHDVPGCRRAVLDHRIELDGRPGDWAAAFALWRAEHAGKGLETAFLSWETRDDTAPTAPEGVTLRRLRCLMFDQPLDPEPLEGAAPVDDLEEVVAFDVRAEPHVAARPDWARWFWGGLLDRAAKGEGTLLGWRHEGALVGTAGIFWGATGREARLAAVVTAPEHRNQGMAGALVLAAIGAYQAQQMGITYAVCAEEGPAERMYRRIGFRRVTCFWLASTPA